MTTIMMMMTTSSVVYDSADQILIIQIITISNINNILVNVALTYPGIVVRQADYAGKMGAYLILSRVGNGVRQGGLPSPSLFSLYMDNLSRQLSDCRTGCIIGNTDYAIN